MLLGENLRALGKKALIGDCGGASLDAERRWNALTSVAALQKLLKLRIPGSFVSSLHLKL
jgi:hypothetical protein